jgi:hypothetical protein
MNPLERVGVVVIVIGAALLALVSWFIGLMAKQ